jgi:S-adenosylmethionine synthetase
VDRLANHKKGGKMNCDFTSESVCSGHGQIAMPSPTRPMPLRHRSLFLRDIETLVTKTCTVVGEVTSTAKLDYKKIAQDTIKSLGYTDPAFGFSADSKYYQGPHQSPEIAQGVDTDGAGDQGMMFGYACNQTSNLMPLPIELAHAITRGIDTARQMGTIPYLRPDGKSQVTVRYEKGKPVGLESIVMAVPHQKQITRQELTHDLYQLVIKPLLEKYHFSYREMDLIVNGTVWHPGPA